MKNISPDFCRKIGQARRDLGISQTSLANELGCKQPALSAFEGGDGTKLSDETVKKLAERLGVQFAKGDENAHLAKTVERSFSGRQGFCPDCNCPSNVPYVVGGRLFLRPSRQLAAPVAGAGRCAICGEVIESRCPSCGAELNDGACCAICGMPYVTPVPPPGADIAEWARRRREEIAALRELS